jgi:predicted nucleic acid-binding protein
MIASVAARFGVTLVTHNTRDFERYSGLHIVDWIDAEEP